jgi:hypothetical protein
VIQTPPSQTRRQAGPLLTLLAGATLTGTWSLVGLRAMTTEEAISVEGLVASLAFAVAGIGVGVLLASLGAGRARRRGRPVPAPGSENLGPFFVLMGLMNVGWGMEPVLQPTPSAWAWLALLFSVGGGALIGFALVLHARQMHAAALRRG